MLPTLAVSTENDALVDPPDRVTEDGTISGALLATLMSTVAPPLGAALDSFTVHTPDEFGPSVLGLHDSWVTAGEVAWDWAGGATCSTKLWELPFNLPTNVAVVEALTAAIVALNVAVVAPWATVTEAGIVTLAVLETDTPTLRPPLGAAADVVKVHDALPGVVRGLGEHVNALSVTGGGGGGANCSTKLCELPFKVPTNVAVVAALTAATVALNVAVDAPWEMATVAGMLTLALLDTVRPTLKPPLGAAADVVKVHDTLPGVVRGLGEHVNALSVTGGGANWSAKLCELPFKVPTKVAVVDTLTAAIMALNVAVVAPCAMVTELGMLPLALLDTPRETLSPPLGAGADAVTVHDAVPGVVNGLGEQDIAVSATG